MTKNMVKSHDVLDQPLNANTNVLMILMRNIIVLMPSYLNIQGRVLSDTHTHYITASVHDG
jgi:hypothetical protein